MLAAGVMFFVPATTSATMPLHPLEDIRNTAREFVMSGLEAESRELSVVTEKLDPRLRLSACQKPLKAWYPGQGRRAGNVTVGIRCADQNPWSIYIPVRVNYYEEVVVADRPLQRGTIISREDLRLERKNISFHAANYFTDPAEVIGKQLVHSLQLGHAISDRNLKFPVIIKRGQQVTLLARADSYEVRMAGMAMMDGVAGQRIKVRNSRSKRIIEGVVKSSKIIYIQ